MCTNLDAGVVEYVLVVQQLRAQVNGSSAYDAEIVATGYVSDDGDSFPLREASTEHIRAVRLKINIVENPL